MPPTTFSAVTLASALSALIALALVALAAERVGALLTRARLPLITGFLLAGVVSGPHALGLLTEDMVLRMRWVEEVALAFIAFAAGAELHFEALQSRLRSIRWITVLQTLAMLGLGISAVWLVSPRLDFMNGLDTSSRLAIALLAATVLLARSPSSAIAVINEVRASGPFTRTVLGVTVASDFVVVILFALSASLATAILQGGGLDWTMPLLVCLELLTAVVLGVGLGRLLGLGFRARLPIAAKALWVLGIGWAVFAGAHSFAHFASREVGFEIFLEPLLVCLVAGFTVSNMGPYRTEFARTIDLSGGPVYVVFFTLAGAGVALDVVRDSWQIALILAAARLLALALGTWVGGTLANEPAHQNRYSWLSYVTQAGIGLGLAREIAAEFQGWGPAFASLMIAVIVVNQLLGPPLFKAALHRSGEARLRSGQRDLRGTPRAFIFGLEGQALALARQLAGHGWRPTIVTRKDPDSRGRPDEIEIVQVEDLTPEELQRIGAQEARAFLLLNKEADALRVAEIAYQDFGTRNVIARSSDRVHWANFEELGVQIVDPNVAMVSLLDQFVRSPSAASMMLGLDKDQEMLEIELGNPDLDGVALRDISLPHDTLVVSVQRERASLVSHGYTRLQMGDVLTLVGSEESLNRIESRFAA
ncbi:MAG: cation:proton antiporter [Acidobacteriota bacterium]